MKESTKHSTSEGASIAWWGLPAAGAALLLALWVRWLESPLVALGALLAANSGRAGCGLGASSMPTG